MTLSSIMAGIAIVCAAALLEINNKEMNEINEKVFEIEEQSRGLFFFAQNGRDDYIPYYGHYELNGGNRHGR